MKTDPLLEAILTPPDALPQALRAARRRRTIRHALTLSPIVVAGLAATLVAFHQPTPTTTENRIPPDPSTPTIPVIRTTHSPNLITTTTAIPVIRTTPKPVPTITDDHLLALASTPGHPAALVHHRGQPQLLTTRP